MTMLTQLQHARVPFRRPSSDAVVVYGLFAVTLVLLACSAVTGWRAAHGGSLPAILHVEAAPIPAIQA